MRGCGDAGMRNGASVIPSERSESRDLHVGITAPRFHAEHAEGTERTRTA